MECPSCHAEGYIKVLDYEEADTDTIEVRTSHGTHRRTRQVAPVVKFFCQKCRHFNGYSVDYDFVPPAPPTQASLEALGKYWETPNREVTVHPDGSRSIRGTY